MRSASTEAPASWGHLDRGVSRESIVDLFHLRDRVEEPDHERRAKGVARLHRPAADLFDQADVVALVAPRLVYVRWIERHPGQPGSVTPGRRIAQMVRPDEAVG